MKSGTIIFIAVLLMGITSNLYAQTDSTTVNDSLNEQHTVADSVPAENKIAVKQQIPHNLIKVNLAALIFNSYSIQYERVLNRKFSVAIQYRIMPENGLPFKSSILKLVNDDDLDTKKTIEDFRISNYAITAEARLYLSKKGYGRGFYIAPFYRYASFTSNDLNVFYNDDNEQSVKMSGKLTCNTFGLATGFQNALGKHVVLDINFFGPHYGTCKGEFNGVSSKPLSPDEQSSLKENLDGIDIPLSNKTIDVNANGASMKLDGPWAGWKITIGLGVRF